MIGDPVGALAWRPTRERLVQTDPTILTRTPIIFVWLARKLLWGQSSRVLLCRLLVGYVGSCEVWAVSDKHVEGRACQPEITKKWNLVQTLFNISLTDKQLRKSSELNCEFKFSPQNLWGFKICA